MIRIWFLLFVALACPHLGRGRTIGSTSQTYPHEQSDTNGAVFEGWGGDGAYALVPALALVLTAVGFLVGCTWCYRHKDCKRNQGAENQLFTGSVPPAPPSAAAEPALPAGEDNNNGPISLREMQNIANNNATVYIASENERAASRESVVHFEPLPEVAALADPLERCADWFDGEDFPRSRVQYLREMGRGWFGRVVEAELDDSAGPTVIHSRAVVKILQQSATLEDKAQFLDEARLYRDAEHENILRYLGRCLQEDPWLLIFEFCPMDLQEYLTSNQANMVALNDARVPLRLQCDAAAALSYLHGRGYLYSNLCIRNLLIRGEGSDARLVLGRYRDETPEFLPRENYTRSTEVWSLGLVLWQVCAWGAPPPRPPAPPPAHPAPHRTHLYQVMQLCWNENPELRPTADQVYSLLYHLYTYPQDDGYESSDFEDRWQRLKPNTIPKIDEHVAIIHAPSTSSASHFTGSEQDFDNSHTIQDILSVDMDTAVSRSSSIMSNKEPLSVQIKSESLTNLHGSLEDVRNIYLTHNENAVLECQQANTAPEDSKDKDLDVSDSSVDPWLKDIIADSHDDVSYYKDVSDVIKNLDNILNSEKTSSSESSHQASPSRDNFSLDCKKDHRLQSSLVKSPGISNFQNILDVGFEESDNSRGSEDDINRDNNETLNHSFERHSETNSQNTLENLSPETPNSDLCEIREDLNVAVNCNDSNKPALKEDSFQEIDKPKDCKEDTSRDSEITKLQDFTLEYIPRISENNIEQVIVQDCHTSCDIIKEIVKTDTQELKYKSDIDISEKKIVKSYDNYPAFGEDNFRSPAGTIDLNTTCDFSGVESDMKQETLIKGEIIVDNKPITVEIQNQNFDRDDCDIKAKKCCMDNCKTTGSIECVKSCTNNKLIHENSTQLDNFSNSVLAQPLRLRDDLHEELKDKEMLVKAVKLESHKIQSDLFENFNSNSENINKNKNVPYVTDELQGVDQIKCTEALVEKKGDYSPLLSKTNLNESQGSVKKTCEKVDLNCQIQHEINNPDTVSEKNTIGNFKNSPQTDKDNIEILLEEDTTEQHLNKKSFRILEAESINNEDQQQSHNTLSLYLNNADVLEDVASFDDGEIKYTNKDSNSHEIIQQETIIKQNYNPGVNGKQHSDTTYEHNSLEPTNSTADTGTLNSCETISNIMKDASLEISARFDKSQPDFLKDNHHPNIDSEESKSLILSSHLNMPTDQLRRGEKTEQNMKNLNENVTVTKNTNCDIESIDVQRESLECYQTLLGDKKENSLSENSETQSIDTESTLPLQNFDNVNVGIIKNYDLNLEDNVSEIRLAEGSLTNNDTQKPHSTFDESTVYLDLTDNKKLNNLIKSESLFYSTNNAESSSNLTMLKNESTVYMDLPRIMDETHIFLCAERILSSQAPSRNDQIKDKISASTPKGSDCDETILNSSNIEEISESKTLDCYLSMMSTLEQRLVPSGMSPFDSPTKSHPTDTFDENSSVLLGPFENCVNDQFKGFKSATGYTEIDVPKEELLAFSSNFSEMNLETPSPLRDVNFLNEVPDIEIVEEFNFDIVKYMEENRSENTQSELSTQVANHSDETIYLHNVHESPSTPPNSPGNFLASTSQQKYLVDIDLSHPLEIVNPSHESDSGVSSLQKEIDLNQIQLQITSKLAMAENENNLNIEYSGPLTVEGLVTEESTMLRESDSMPEALLAGNGGSAPEEEIRKTIALDEESMAALRNELELKLPLAQVASIEPSEDVPAWNPMELVVKYPGALSPIMEETGHQLSAYENDRNWNNSNKTDSSESYLEPCNNSTDEVTDLTMALHSGLQGATTYTIHSTQDQSMDDGTYTIQKDITTSKDLTMSVDSLNESPAKDFNNDTNSPVNERTFTIDDDKGTNFEHISQVSPCILSPTTETSLPENSENLTGVSILSRTTVPTDAKSSIPSETQCLSKATSIDSWCSNDTLFNVEDNFDDLIMDPDVSLDIVQEKESHSESSDTLTHNDDEKELSHCSTYIVHNSKSEASDTFSPDSITANCTFTKVKTAISDEMVPKTEINDSSTKDTHTKDLAYETLLSGLASSSNCATELLSGVDDVWKLQQPELVRRSPIIEDMLVGTPPKIVNTDHNSSKLVILESIPRIKKMESIEISCFNDNSTNASDEPISSDQIPMPTDADCSPSFHFRNMANSVQSTPLLEIDINESGDVIPINLPSHTKESSGFSDSVEMPNFKCFLHSAELRPQDISSHQNDVDSEILSSHYLGNNPGNEPSPTYSDFENSAMGRSQDITKSSQNQEIASCNSDEFNDFKHSLQNRPQDLSAIGNLSSSFLRSEGISSGFGPSISTNVELDQTVHVSTNGNFSNPDSKSNPDLEEELKEVSKQIVLTQQQQNLESCSNHANSCIIPQILETYADDNDQPHSIIVTDITNNMTFNSHSQLGLELDHTYDSHNFYDQQHTDGDLSENNCPKAVNINGLQDKEEVQDSYMGIVLSNQVTTDNQCDVIDQSCTEVPNGFLITETSSLSNSQVDCNKKDEKFATVNFINESFEELVESNVDGNDSIKENKSEFENEKLLSSQEQNNFSAAIPMLNKTSRQSSTEVIDHVPINGLPNSSNDILGNTIHEVGQTKITNVTDTFLQNEKNFCQIDSYLPLLGDIRFTGPTSEIMSTSFNQESPTEPDEASDKNIQSNGDAKSNGAAAQIVKEWDSDSEDSQSSNSSSGEFIWKHRSEGGHAEDDRGAADEGGPGDSGSGSGSEGDEVEFVPSSWDCRAAPSKSSLRSLEQAQPLSEGKKRVVFKRQKYHCVYEYPREAADCTAHLPDYSTYADWAAAAAEEAELSYSQLYGGHPFDVSYPPLGSARPFGTDYDEDFFITSSSHPFESLGIMSSTSQFFPGMSALKEPPPPILDNTTPTLGPLTPTVGPPTPTFGPNPATFVPTATVLGPTTPDSGVEDITPGSETNQIVEGDALTCWRSVDSPSPGEPASPAELGGLRHTRDRLKLDLPPSPRVPSPKQTRVFSFVLDKATPPNPQEHEEPEPTFSTFGKDSQKPVESKSLVLTDEEAKGNDSGDEDSGIESSAKASLERPPPDLT